ncbi:helix-turn-helix domain-containing protein [Chelativorans alearense]|uniref:helix-turn-helix domain-containing protein n=1 Tax=Chelativorans alearense TaxID=2681495 RepID=UPI0013D5A70E|nr:helix-turn-helix transcriptional regulator [Chelativorans alearense]
MGETGQDDAGQEPWRVWLRSVVGSHGGVTAVARLAEVPKQTLDNYLSGRTKKPNLDYLHRIAAACAVEMTWLKASADQAAEATVGLDEPEVIPYEGPSIAFQNRVPANRGRWTVKTRALDLAGILPGDVMEFEMGREPQVGQPVVAQVYDDEGSATTVLRLFYPPYLMVRSSDPGIDPRPLDLDPPELRVKVMGAFVRLWRLAGGDPAA